jgi:aerobic carbon-monoxide dehydrogenase small subunit
MTKAHVDLVVNGSRAQLDVEPRRLLADALRHDLGLTGTHLGCEHGVCGACTVLVDGEAVRSCLMLAVQADGCVVDTIEGAGDAAGLHPVQQAFVDEHGLQCGFCTPGLIMATIELLRHDPDPTDDEIREQLSGNICRCTGYVHVVRAVRRAAADLAARRGDVA